MKYLAILFSAVIMAAACPELSGQDYTPVPVTISKEKVKVDGKVYYSHIVTERQTLYSICKAYGVTMEQIYEVNPTVRTEGLKKNAILLIPVIDSGRGKSQGNQHPAVRKTAPAKDSGKKDSGNGDPDYIIHTVKWYEDLDVIAEKYNVTVDDIMLANNLTGRKLSRRQKLRIPTVKPAGGAVAATDTVSVPDPTTDTVSIQTAQEMKGKVSAVLLLPFNAKGERPRSGSMDFYCGVLMAARQFAKNGTDIDLSVYDVEDGTLPVTDEVLSSCDVIIGPVSSPALARLLSEHPAGNGVVSPLDHKAEYLAGSYRNFIQGPTSVSTLYADLAEWIREEKSADERVIVIYEKGARNIEELAAMNTILEKDGISFSTFSYSILEGRDVQEPLKKMMNAEAVNRVLVMSESEAFVNDVVRNLNMLIHDDLDIVLYGPSKIRSFETIEVDNLHNTGFHTSLAYYVNYEENAVKDFIKGYRALYNTEPTPYAFQGYDIATYFFQICSDYGKNWRDYLENNDKSLLQADFRFRGGEGNEGYVNTGVRRIVYGSDYSIMLK